MTIVPSLMREVWPARTPSGRLRLTDRGRALEKDIDTEITRVTERALSGLSPADRDTLTRALRTIHRNLLRPEKAAAE